MQVVEPVVTTTLVPVEMDTDMAGATPDSTMGPGLPAPSPEMPLVFNANDRQKQRDDEEWTWKWAEEAFHHPMDPVDDEDFNDMMEK